MAAILNLIPAVINSSGEWGVSMHANLYVPVELTRNIGGYLHTTTLFSLFDHYILSREWRVIVDQVQTNYHGRPMVLKSVRCDQAVDYDGSSLWSDVF